MNLVGCEMSTKKYSNLNRLASSFRQRGSLYLFEIFFPTFPASSTRNRGMVTSSILVCKLIKSDSVTETFFSKNIVETAKNDIGSRQSRRSLCQQVGTRAFCCTLFSSITKMLRILDPFRLTICCSIKTHQNFFAEFLDRSEIFKTFLIEIYNSFI